MACHASLDLMHDFAFMMRFKTGSKIRLVASATRLIIHSFIDSINHLFLTCSSGGPGAPRSSPQLRPRHLQHQDRGQVIEVATASYLACSQGLAW